MIKHVAEKNCNIVPDRVLMKISAKGMVFGDKEFW